MRNKHSAGSYVRMRGLPFSATSQDVVRFLSNEALDPTSIFFCYDSSGRPSGETYCGFCTTYGVKLALQRHKARMGPRYIEMFASSLGEVQRLARQRKLRMDTSTGSRAFVSPHDVHIQAPTSFFAASEALDGPAKLQKQLCRSIKVPSGQCSQLSEAATCANTVAASPRSASVGTALSSPLDIPTGGPFDVSSTGSMYLHEGSYLPAAQQHVQLSATGSHASSTWAVAPPSWPHAGQVDRAQQQVQYMGHSQDDSMRQDSWQSSRQEGSQLYNMWAGRHALQPLEQQYACNEQRTQAEADTIPAWDPLAPCQSPFCALQAW